MKMRYQISPKAWYKRICEVLFLWSYGMLVPLAGKSHESCAPLLSVSDRHPEDKICTQPRRRPSLSSYLFSRHPQILYLELQSPLEIGFFLIIYLSILPLGEFQAWIINKRINVAPWVQFSQPVAASSPSLRMPAEVILLGITKCPDHHC